MGVSIHEGTWTARYREKASEDRLCRLRLCMECYLRDEGELAAAPLGRVHSSMACDGCGTTPCHGFIVTKAPPRKA